MLPISQIAIISMISHMLFIYVTWRVFVGINFDSFIRKGRETEARILLFFVAIIIGSGVSRFFLDILQWSQDLIYLL